MKKHFIITAFLFHSLAFAGPEDQIREYIKQIEQTQKDIAGTLVLLNFSRYMADQNTGSRLSSELNFILGPEQDSGLTHLSESFFDTIYSNETDLEKINGISKILITVRSTRHHWISLGASTRGLYEDFYSNFSSTESVCSDQNFYHALSVIENFSPSGISTGILKLGQNLTIGANANFSESGDASIGFYANLDRPHIDNNEKNAREAVATTAGALAFQFVPPPYNIAAGIILPILIEVVWGTIDMHKKMSEIDRLASANRELYGTMRFEINVKKHYQNYCNEFERAFAEVRPAVVQAYKFRDPSLLQRELKKVPQVDAKEMKEILGHFYDFTRAKLIKDALIMLETDSAYVENWRIVMGRIDDFINNIDKALGQIISQRYTYLGPGRAHYFIDVLNRVDSLAAFKAAYTKGLIQFFDAKRPEVRSFVLKDLRWMIEHYEISHPDLSVEETQVVKAYRESLEKMEAFRE